MIIIVMCTSVVTVTYNNIPNPLFCFFGVMIKIEYKLLSRRRAFEKGEVTIFMPAGFGPLVILVVIAQALGDVFMIKPQGQSPEADLYIFIERCVFPMST